MAHTTHFIGKVDSTCAAFQNFVVAELVAIGSVQWRELPVTPLRRGDLFLSSAVSASVRCGLCLASEEPMPSALTPGNLTNGQRCVAGLLLTFCLFSGCGTTIQATATDQMVASDAVDRSISQIDFTPLTGQRVYLDTSYIQSPKTPTGIGFVNPEYVVSGIRQQMMAAGLELMETRDQAEFIVEARLGVLGGDSHELVYGIPSGSGIGSAASSAVAATTSVPLLPSLPELAFAKRKDHVAAVKVAVFAYHRETRQRAWQSGIALGKSSAHDYWLLGAGPFQRGDIYKGVQLAGNPVDVPLASGDQPNSDGPISAYRQRMIFEAASQKKPPSGIQQATAEVPAEGVK